MDKFIKGNCVAVPRVLGAAKDFSKNNRSHFSTIHILSQKDIDRGYYWCNNGESSVDLNTCEHTIPNFNFINRCQTLKGKITQPISKSKYTKKILENTDKGFTPCHIIFKGNKTKVNGILSSDRKVLYFQTNPLEFYKTKVYVDKEGYLKGLNFSGYYKLSNRRKRTSKKFKD